MLWLLSPAQVKPKQQRYTLDDMLERIRQHYERKENRSFDNTVKHCWKHLAEYFEFHRVIDIAAAPEKIEAYQTARLKNSPPASINREVAYLRLGLRLMHKAGEIPSVPPITLLAENNVREGFIKNADFAALLERIPNENARDVVEFLYCSGWRSREGKEMRWAWIDFDEWTVTLPAEYSKNKQPRVCPLEDTLREIIQRRIKLRDPGCPYVFHRRGRQLKSFRKAFQAAAKAIGKPGLLPHDMRRSAGRNFRRSGLKESEAMKLSGHKTG